MSCSRIFGPVVLSTSPLPMDPYPGMSLSVYATDSTASQCPDCSHDASLHPGRNETPTCIACLFLETNAELRRQLELLREISAALSALTAEGSNIIYTVIP